MSFCTTCGAELRPNAVFCPACGAKQQPDNNNDTAYFDEDDDFGATQLLTPDPPAAFCTGCGTKLAPGSGFCTACGQKTTDRNARQMPFNAPPAASQPVQSAVSAEKIKEFKSYMSINRVAMLFFSILIPAVYAVILIAEFDDMDTTTLLLSLICVIMFEAAPLLILISSIRFFKKLEKDSSFASLVEEFHRAVPMQNDQARFGETHIFTKKSLSIVKYSDITRVYQYIHKTNFVEDQRALKCTDVNKKEIVLCKLKLKDKSDAELQKMVAFILQKNPKIKIGYH